MSDHQGSFGPEASPPSASGPELLRQQQQGATPSAVKLTRGTSCVLCQQRKVRCDKKKPCAGCVKIGVDCKVVPPQPPRRRGKRLQYKDLVARLKRYEALLTENGIKYDAIGHGSRSEAPHHEDVDELENDFEGLQTTPGAHSYSTNSTQRAENEQLLHNSSEDEEAESTIHRAYDKMYTNNDGLPFVIAGRELSTTHCHPSPVQIFQLWQIYIDNVNTLLKVTHVPSTQVQVIQASSDLENVPKNMEALMFAFYAMAVQSMEEVDVQKMFRESKREVSGRFLSALQQALLNADFMRMNDLFSLQAYLLYLLAVRWTMDPRQVFCLVGIAVRIAQRMGLHQDPAVHGLAPFEVEQRRRLWWTIVSHDRRIGEITGSTVTALSSGCDCKLPLNVNDSDLHIDGTGLPKPHSGPTEMLFALTRLEIAMAVVSDRNRDSAKIKTQHGSTSASSPRQDCSSSSSSSFSKVACMPTIRVAGQDSPPYTLDGFCAHMEETYLRHCDPKIPLHLFTVTMTRQTLSKMHVIAYLMRMYRGEHPLEETERESLFLLSIQMVEYDNVVHASESLKPYKWFTTHHFPFPAYMFLVQELRQRCHGRTVERAWKAICSNHDLRGMTHKLYSPIYAVFGRHFVKAWDAHCEACVANGQDAPATPVFVALLRQRMETNRKGTQQDADSDTLSTRFGAAEFRGRASTHTNVLLTSSSATGVPQCSHGSSALGGIGMSMGVAANQDVSDMDWSYLVSNFSPDVGFASGAQGFQSSAPFASDAMFPF
ncbi:hypothetical protein E4U42_005945 [Claviceps africana]|uniref:Zn(2)-C6 fungal-type domain-containing protein n=1 Tax=Claviceps africana TaxID=83212 RepID=A0A8K0J935_9HYPO|nr:hypothetical protein E4U42_005945 [Claviceps africana]